MGKNVGYLIASFACFVIALIILQALFILVEPAYFHLSLSDFLAVITHGFPMTLTVAGYFSIIPLLLTIISVWATGRWLAWIAKGYYALAAAIISIITVVDAALYPYWGFRIDMTPIFYFSTSPAAAMASVELWMGILGILAMATLWLGIYALQAFVWNLFHRDRKAKKRQSKHASGNKEKKMTNRNKLWTTGMLILCGGLIFLAIRGGVTVSTMNPSRCYFSSDMKLNHAAVNPMFNLLYSATHQDKFDRQFRFMEAQEASSIMASLRAEDAKPNGLLADHPDVYIIILESFSSHLLPSLGGDPIAMSLDSIAREGLTFTNAYASSFRTDRSLTAILSGFPAPPTVSLLKFVDKLDNIESIPRSLGNAGYTSAYYYGGDINFTNVKAYLVASGVDKIIADSDFPVSKRLSKWGVHDGPLFDRVKEDEFTTSGEEPRLVMIQTSSSHEPFEVPWDADENPRINAFKYADAMLGRFIADMKASGKWNNALVIITPDHYGVYPDLSDPAERHKIPIIFTGGAAKRIGIDRSTHSAPVAQTDIAATLLSLLGIEYQDDFPYSNDAFNQRHPAQAFFSEPSWAAVADSNGVTVISTETGEKISENPVTESSENIIKAYLQTLYDDLQQR